MDYLPIKRYAYISIYTRVYAYNSTLAATYDNNNTLIRIQNKIHSFIFRFFMVGCILVVGMCVCASEHQRVHALQSMIEVKLTRALAIALCRFCHAQNAYFIILVKLSLIIIIIIVVSLHFAFNDNLFYVYACVRSILFRS